MITFTTKVTGINEVISGLHRAIAEGPNAQAAEIRTLGEKHIALMKDATPIGRGEPHSPRLRDNYRLDFHFGSTVGYKLTNDAPYLPFVLRGRGPVTATRAKALRFVIGGQVFFRKSVGPAAPNRFDQQVRAQVQIEAHQAGLNIRTRIVRAYRGA